MGSTYISVKYEESISTDAFQFVKKLLWAVFTAGSDIGIVRESLKVSNGEYVEGRFSSDRLGYRVVRKELREVSGVLKESGIRLPPKDDGASGTHQIQFLCSRAQVHVCTGKIQAAKKSPLLVYQRRTDLNLKTFNLFRMT